MMETSSTYSIIMDLFLIVILAVVLFATIRISSIFINYLLTGSKIKQRILRIFYFNIIEIISHMFMANRCY